MTIKSFVYLPDLFHIIWSFGLEKVRLTAYLIFYLKLIQCNVFVMINSNFQYHY